MTAPSWYKLADVNGHMHVTNSRVFNNNDNKKVARNLRTNSNTFTEWKANERKRYFRIAGCIYVTWSFSLPIPEEHMLPFSLLKRESGCLRQET